MPGASLLNIHVRNAMLRQCKPHARQGKLAIEGAYHPELIKRALGPADKWKTIATNGRNIGEILITDPNQLADILAFQARIAFSACIMNMRTMRHLHGRNSKDAPHTNSRTDLFESRRQAKHFSGWHLHPCRCRSSSRPPRLPRTCESKDASAASTSRYACMHTLTAHHAFARTCTYMCIHVHAHVLARTYMCM